MSEKENARSNAATLEQAGERCLDSVSFCSEDTTFSGARQPSTYLSRGESNAIPARELAKLMGFSDTRPLRLAIERERREGVLILSSDRGYFLPSLDDEQAEREVAVFVRRTDARLRSNRQSVRACKRWLRRRKRREITGQVRLFDEAGL